MYNKDDVVVINNGPQVAIWWGHTPYIIPKLSAVPIPKVVYEACKDHDDYKDLEFVTNPEGGADDFAQAMAKELKEGPVAAPPPNPDTDPVVTAASAPERITEPDADTDPDWNATDCDYEEVEAYIKRHNLIIDPDADEQKVRELVDEHMQG